MAKAPKANFGEMLRAMNLDRGMASRLLFDHRHPQASPDFHTSIDELWRSVHPQVVLEVFRGGAKTTKSEESVILDGLFQTCNYQLLVGESYEKACQSLYNIKKEFKTNEKIIAIFGDCTGDTWRENEIVLSNEVKIQAVGQDQEQRGFKHGHYRPDRIIIDDVEKRSMILNQKYREDLWTWIFSEILPALDPIDGKVRVIGTSLHADSLVSRLRRNPHWVNLVVPVCDDEMKVSNWPSRFPIEVIKKKQQEYAQGGQLLSFFREMMCKVTDEANKNLDTSKLRAVQTAPSLPKFVAIDPARTVGDKSDRTGVAVGAWVGSTLYLYKTYAKKMMPSAIIETCFELDKEYSPISLGIETNSLEQFIMQPLRSEMLRRNHVMPLEALRAPGNKGQFIMGLQPFLDAGDIVIVGEHPDLINEMNMYPGGHDDVLNAVAYLMLMRSGKSVYQDFTADSITDFDFNPRIPMTLALNQKDHTITGCLVQFDGLNLLVMNDWISQEMPEEALKMMNAQIKQLYPNTRVGYSVPADLHEKWNVSPLVHALRKKDISRGAYIFNSYNALNEYTRMLVRGRPALLISPDAKWTVNAMAGGYCHEVLAGGMEKPEPKSNDYRTLMQGLESCVKALDNQVDEDNLNYSVTNKGRQYLSTIANG